MVDLPPPLLRVYWVARNIFPAKSAMSNNRNPRRLKRGSYSPKPETLALLKVSGNPINGLGETTPRRPSPFFWHPPDQHPYGELQVAARQNMCKCPGYEAAFAGARSYPELMASLRSAQPIYR